MPSRDPGLDVDPDALGRAVAALRAERGLRRRDLQERSGLSYPYIAEIENGAKQPSMTALGKLAGALDVTPAELLERAEVLAATVLADPEASSAAVRYERSGDPSGSRWFHADAAPAARPLRRRSAVPFDVPAAPPADERRVADLTVAELEDLIRGVVREEMGRE